MSRLQRTFPGFNSEFVTVGLSMLTSSGENAARRLNNLYSVLNVLPPVLFCISTVAGVAFGCAASNFFGQEYYSPLLAVMLNFPMLFLGVLVGGVWIIVSHFRSKQLEVSKLLTLCALHFLVAACIYQSPMF